MIILLVFMQVIFYKEDKTLKKQIGSVVLEDKGKLVFKPYNGVSKIKEEESSIKNDLRKMLEELEEQYLWVIYENKVIKNSDINIDNNGVLTLQYGKKQYIYDLKKDPEFVDIKEKNKWNLIKNKNISISQLTIDVHIPELDKSNVRRTIWFKDIMFQGKL